jgi:HSP20 family molecular chaperone IbpA
MTTETTDTSNRTTEPESTRDVPVYRAPTDIHDTGTAVVLTLEMPGVGRDDVDIDLERRVLSIRGRGRVTSPEGYRLVHAEYGEGDYERVFTLSEEIDEAAIQAEVENGVLTLTLPRAEATKPRRIEVKARGPAKRGEE